jgi:hypothetical protein
MLYHRWDCCRAWPPEMAGRPGANGRFKAELLQMLEEHKAIVAALSHLVEVAKQEHKLEYAHFAEKLMLHAQTEEECIVPDGDHDR